MKETIRCCISCILPCGVLDVIRIVHANGRVEEISRQISAGEIMEAYPKHVLRRPPCMGEESQSIPKALILPPSAELQRGKIYFLMPVSEKPKRSGRKKKSTVCIESTEGSKEGSKEVANSDRARLLMSDQYLSEILAEKASTLRDRRRGRVGVWRPHLESIDEVSSDL